MRPVRIHTEPPPPPTLPVWTPAAAVLQLLVKGELSARDAAVQMTNQIAKAISQQG